MGRSPPARGNRSPHASDAHASDAQQIVCCLQCTTYKLSLVHCRHRAYAKYNVRARCLQCAHNIQARCVCAMRVPSRSCERRSTGQELELTPACQHAKQIACFASLLGPWAGSVSSPGAVGGSLLPIPVNGSIARGDQRLSCSMRGSMEPRIEQLSR